MFDLERYLDRLGVEPDATLAELHRAHATSITFEGLSAHVGEGVPLDSAALAAKLVDGGRGGYCFELQGFELDGAGRLLLGTERRPGR